MSVPDTDDPPTMLRKPPEPAAGRPRPAPPPERLALRVDEPRQTARSSAPVILTVLLVLAVGGLGYCGWLLFDEKEHSAAYRHTSQAAYQTLQVAHTRAGKQIAELEQAKTEQTQRAQEADVELLELKATLAAAQARLGDLESERAELSAQMAEYRKVTQQFRSMIDSGKLAVNFRRGRMIVELPAAVLFASGSAELSPEGSTALKEVAAILQNVPGKRFIVAGHTDNVPISKAQTGYNNNWALSAGRAVTVTESLLSAGLQPTHLVAAGYGEYDPIANNSSAEGRKKNRRIEIVLEPELQAMPGALKEKADAAGTNQPAPSQQPMPSTAQ